MSPSPPRTVRAYHSPLLTVFHIFFFNDTATTEIYTLSLHDALPICPNHWTCCWPKGWTRCLRATSAGRPACAPPSRPGDRKSTRLNSSHLVISYAVFCLKKKNMHVTLMLGSSASYV